MSAPQTYVRLPVRLARYVLVEGANEADGPFSSL